MNKATIVRFKADTDEYNAKVKKAKDSLKQFGEGGKQAGQMMGQLDSILGTSLGTLTKLSAGVGAVSGALKVAKDAFFNNEEQLDTWGRTVNEAESVYKGFLNALNTGDIGGYLSNIDSICDAAKKAYDALDNLGTFNAFNQVNSAKAKAGLEGAIAAYKEGNGSKAAVEKAKKTYIAELKTRQKLEEQAYNESIRKYAAERGADPKMFAEAMKGTYGNYETLKSTKLTGKSPIYGTTMYGSSYKIGERAVAANKKEALGEVLRKFNDTELQELQALGAKAFQTSQEIAAISKQTSRILNPKEKTTKPKGKPRDTSIKVDSSSLGLSGLGMEGVDIGDGKLPPITLPVEAEIDWSKFIELEDEMERIKGEADAEAMFQSWNEAANGISAVGAALSQIEDPTAKVLGIVAEAIANVALTFAKSLKGTVSPWDWIAGAAAGTATMIGTITAIKSATAGSYADGGIIGGPDTGGRDSKWAYVSPGELILNKAQQRSLAGQLAGDTQPRQAQSYVSGEQLVTVINNYGRRSGRGEILK